jgi:two-component system chemotaxis response regulator CheY
VDDEDSIREALTDTLEFLGYRVESAANGQQALAKVKSTRPDAIVLDLMMPVMDGWTFMHECRKDPDCVYTPVLVISAHRALQDTTSDLDVQACLAKPFDLDVLVGAVERLLREAPGDHSEDASH